MSQHTVFWTHADTKIPVGAHPTEDAAHDHAARLTEAQRASIADLCRRNDNAPVPAASDLGAFSVEPTPLPPPRAAEPKTQRLRAAPPAAAEQAPAPERADDITLDADAITVVDVDETDAPSGARFHQGLPID
jgi:hypothetical protein